MKLKCSKCCKVCKELFTCDCAEYSDLCEECWYYVPHKHRELVCFMEWIDYSLDRDKSSLI